MVRTESEWDKQKADYEKRIKLLQEVLQRVPKVTPEPQRVPKVLSVVSVELLVEAF